ncbi:transglutaminase-like domain-containing protein [Clostridium sp.]|uniref:transglutaminase-like domain-containing protein n=1 Tax=Clostridium sp. TaxID=1506 RepID=UPI0039943770
MNKYVYLLAIAVFIIPLIMSYFKRFDKKSLYDDFNGGARTLLKLIAFAIAYYIVKSSNVIERGISSIISHFNFSIISPAMTAYIMLVIIFLLIIYIIYVILRGILIAVNNTIIKSSIRALDARKNGKKSGISGVLFNLPNACSYLLIVFLVVTILPVSNLSALKQDFSNIVTNTERIVSGKKPIDQAFTTSSSNDGNNVIVYYNGVKLSTAVKSDAAINNMAKEITAGDTTDLEKAKAIYTWVGNNVTYSDQKADEINKTGGEGIPSGAIPAFNTRSGVCFDYASLYVAMARAVGLKVRMVSGEGYTGTEWGPHAWNEVYIPSEGKWIPVDPTFESSGDFFDTSNFYDTHRDAKVIGQW